MHSVDVWYRRKIDKDTGMYEEVELLECLRENRSCPERKELL